MKTDLNRINNRLRLNLIGNLSKDGIRRQNAHLQRLSEQICQQIIENTDLVVGKCQGLNQPGVRQQLSQFRDIQFDLVQKQRDMNALMQVQRDLVLESIENERVRQQVEEKQTEW